MPVVLPPGCASDLTNPAATMSSVIPTSGTVCVSACSACKGSSGPATIASGGGVDQRCGLLGEMLIGRLKTTRDNYEIVPLDKAVLAQLVKESGNSRRLARRRHQKAETIDAAAFLRPRCERPGGR